MRDNLVSLLKLIAIEHRQSAEHDLAIYAKRIDEFRENLKKFADIDHKRVFHLDHLEKRFKEVFEVESDGRRCSRFYCSSIGRVVQPNQRDGKFAEIFGTSERDLLGNDGQIPFDRTKIVVGRSSTSTNAHRTIDRRV